MAIITLTEAKHHLRITDTSEDTILQLYIDAAEEYITTFLDRQYVPRNAAVKAAALLTVADLFENREGAGDKDIKENPAVMRLLYPYRSNLGL